MDGNIKYYIYLSRVKVEMLWGQISQNDLKKISAELKINAGFFSGGVKSETKDHNLYKKLDVVLKYLENRDMIGSLGNPRTFFKGTLPMSWQEIEFYEKDSGRIVLFSGFDQASNRVVGLVGSVAHIIGMHNLEPESFDYAQSSFWVKIADELNPPEESKIIEQLYEVDNQITYEAKRREGGPPKRNIEFVAKTFVTDEGFLLGSPIYISEVGMF
jgi:hypothetical protein